jgi:HPt (histidine-containing phosphotransfer) domain-containing protein
VNRLVDLYLETTPPLVARIAQSLQRADAPSLAYAAHTLKGSLSEIANTTARDLAAEVETLARAGKLSEAGEVARELENRLVEFETSVREWRQEQG